MTKLTGVPQDPHGKTGAGSSRRWTAMRDEVRALINAELDRLNPTDDARRPLALILESSIRYSDVDGRTAITVVDGKGRPRTIARSGQSVPMTLQDLVSELRTSHPRLFRPAAPKQEAAPAPAAVAAAPVKPAEPAPVVEAKPVVEPKRARRPRPRPEGAARFHRQRGRVRYHGWARKAKPVAPLPEPELPFVEDRPALLPEARDVGSRRGLIAAASLLALLGAGAAGFLLAWDRIPPPQPSTATEAPSAPAATASTPARSNAPAPAAASAPRTLRGVPDVIDTATLSLEGEVVRLFGVEWAPGGGKPDDLTAYLQGREVVCDPAGGDLYRCHVGDQDLSRVVLFNGGGKPTSEATPELKAAADRAREARRGVWNP